MKAGMRRGLFSLAALTALASAAQANELAFRVDTAPTNSQNGVFTVYDTNATQVVSGFHWELLYDPNEVDGVSVVQANNDLDINAHGPYDVTGFADLTKGIIFETATGADVTLTNGELFKIVVDKKDSYTGSIHLKLVEPIDGPGQDYYTGPGGEIEVTNLGAAIPVPAFAKPTVTKVQVNYSITGSIADKTVQITGENFVPDTDDSIRTQIVLPGSTETIIDPTVSDSQHLTFTLPASYLTSANTTALVDSFQIYVDNNVANSSHPERSDNVAAANYYVVSRDRVWVDNSLSSPADGDVVSITDSGTDGDTTKVVGANTFTDVAPAISNVNVNGTIRVRGTGTPYQGNYTLNKAGVKLEGFDNGSGKPVLKTLSAATINERILQITADDTTVDGVAFDLESHTGVAVAAVNRNKLTVQNSNFSISAAGGKAGSIVPGGGGWGPKGIVFSGAGSSPLATLTNNTFTCPGYFKNTSGEKRFSYAMQVRNAGVSATGNNSSGAYRDMHLAYASGTLSGNTFGFNVDVESNAGALTFTGNNFASFDSAFQHEEASLTIRGCQTAAVNVTGNTFTDIARGVWVGGSKSVTLSGNTFSPAASVDAETADPVLDSAQFPENRYAAIVVDSLNITSAGSGEVGVTVSGNTVSDATAAIGRGIVALNRGAQANYALTINANNNISGTDVAVDVDGAAATLTGNSLANNAIGVKVHNGGSANATGNTMTNNAIQLASEVTASGDATVNGKLMPAKAWQDLEAVAFANTVSGQTYVTDGVSTGSSALLQAETAGDGTYTYLRSAIQSSINAADAGDTVQAMPGAYVEDVNVNKALVLHGTGYDNTWIVGPYNAGSANTVFMGSAYSTIEGFTITRNGNTPATWESNVKNQGLNTAQHAGNILVQNNRFVGNRNAIYVNQGHDNIIRNNIIDDNRTGLQLVNDCSRIVVTENQITNNWTLGLLMYDSGGSPSQDVEITNNNISDNWYAQVNLRIFAGANPVNLSGNWFGTNSVSTVPSNSTEPGYVDTTKSPGDPDRVHIPKEFDPVNGDERPATSQIIGGTNSAKVDFNGWLDRGDDTNSVAMGFQGDLSYLHLSAASPVANGGTGNSHITDAMQVLADGDLIGGNRILALHDGTYSEAGGVASKSATIVSLSNDKTKVTFDGNYLYGSTPINEGLLIAAADVTVKDLTFTEYSVAINRTGNFGNTLLQNLAITNSGHFSGNAYPNGHAPAVRLSQGGADTVGATAMIDTCSFSNNGYAHLALLGADAEVKGCAFGTSEYLGVYANHVNADQTPGNLLAKVNVHNNTFTDNEVAVRVLDVASGSVIGGATSAAANTFNLGVQNGPKTGKASIGASVEWARCDVLNNTFNRLADNIAGLDGDNGSIGVYVWKASNQAIQGNQFTTSLGTKSGYAIKIAGQRLADLASSGGNDAITNGISISGNTVSGYKNAVKLYASDSGARAISATVGSNNAITNCDSGILVAGANATATVQNNLGSIHGNTVGVEVAEGNATISGNHIYDNVTGINVGAAGTAAITGNDFTDAALNTTDLANAGTVSDLSGDNKFAASGKYIVNTSAQYIDATDNLFDAADPSTLDVASSTDRDTLYSIENKITHVVDNSANGLVQVKDNYVFASTTKMASAATLGNSVSANGALDGDTVLIQEGSYASSGGTVSGKAVSIKPEGAAGTVALTMSGPLTLNLAGGLGINVVDGINFTGTASPAAVVALGAGSDFSIQNCNFDNMSAVALSSAILVNGASDGSITSCNATGNQRTVVTIADSQNVTVQHSQFTNNQGTGVVVYKNAAPCTGISIADCHIENNGSVGGNLDAYGVFMHGTGAFPYGSNNSITGCSITGNSASGIWIGGQCIKSDGTVDVGVTNVVGNTIEENGVAMLGSQYNTDGIKLRNTCNTTIENNYIRNNVRAGILVRSESGAEAGKGTIIHNNHISGQTVHADGLVAGLLLQLYNAPTSTDFVNANDNWWGHVYGPKAGPNTVAGFNPIGRGDAYEEQGGHAVLTSWYGQRAAGSLFWRALNDRDGDGINDADEDVNLDGNYDTTEVEPGNQLETKRGDATSIAADRDSDGDGYEDGVEVALGTNPNSAASAPTATEAANYADLVKTSTVDSDNDGFLDFYEVGHKIPAGALGSAKPTLGDVDHSGSVITAGDVTLIRRVLVGDLAISHQDDPNDANDAPTLYQDDMDLNRDGVVSNVDAIGLRRFAAVETHGSSTYKLPMQ